MSPGAQQATTRTDARFAPHMLVGGAQASLSLVPALTGHQTTRALPQLLGGPPPRAIELLAAIALLAAATALLAWRTRRRGHPRAARFATRGELAQLHVTQPTPGRVTLGVHHGRLLAAQPRASVLVVGPSQAGKTTGLVVPALLEWQGPVLATSIKSDVVHDTHAARTARGDVRVFDPTSSSGLPHAPWSPITAATTWQGARRTAARLLGVGEHGHSSSADEAFWRPAGARFLAPLLLAASNGELTMREVLAWVANTDEDDPTALLQDSPAPGAEPALEALRSVWDADPRFRSSLLQTVATALDAWQEPQVAAATIGDTQITPSWLLESTNTLYLISPAHDQRRLRGLFAALIADVIAVAFERSTQTGKPIDPPLLLALDEAANVAPLPNLDEIASTGPGQGVQLLTVLQNLSQAQDRWGQDRAETIIANHRARLFTSGIGDRATLEHLTHTLGEEEINRTATHRRGPLQPGSHTHSTEFRALAPPNRIRQQQADTALLAYGRLPPAWLHLRPWFKDPQLRATAAGNPTPTTPPKRTTRHLRASHPPPHPTAPQAPQTAPTRRRAGHQTTNTTTRRSDMNSVNITGRLTADPTLRSLQNGTAACKIRLAVRGLARGEEEVGYIDVTSYGPAGEAAANVLEKGWLVAVTGRLQYHDWETQEGTKRRDWEIIGQIQFLAAPRENNSNVTALPTTSAAASTPADPAQPEAAAA